MYKVGSSLTLARLKRNFKSFSKLWFCSLNDIVLLILWDDFGNDDLEQQYRTLTLLKITTTRSSDYVLLNSKMQKTFLMFILDQ